MWVELGLRGLADWTGRKQRTAAPTAAFPILISPRLLTSFPAGLTTGHFCLLFHSSGFLFFLFFVTHLFLSGMFVSFRVSRAVSVFVTFTHCCFLPFFPNSLSLPWPDGVPPESPKSLPSARTRYTQSQAHLSWGTNSVQHFWLIYRWLLGLSQYQIFTGWLSCT